MPDAEVQQLWNVYRTGKCFPTELGAILSNAGYHRPHEAINQFDFYESSGREPRPGSSYWVETIDPPRWFIDQEGDADVRQVLSAMAPGRRGAPKLRYKSNRRQRRRKGAEPR